MRGRTLAVLGVSAGLLAAAACGAPSSGGGGGNDTDKSAAAATHKKFSESQDPKAVGPAAPVPGAQKGGTLTVLSSSVPHTFDPNRAYYLDVMSIMRLTSRTLTTTKYVDGKPVLVPDLATDLGDASKDFKTWTFHLKKGIKYQDGTEVKAQDIAYAIKRQMDPVLSADGPTYGHDYYVDGDKYKGPFTSGPDFKAVETPDNYTLVIHLRTGWPSLRYYASLPTFTPIPAAKDTKQDYENHQMTTGPYKFDKFQKTREITLVKNKYWDPKTDPMRHQYVDEFDFKFGLDDLKLQKTLVADHPADQASMTYNSMQASIYQTIRGKPAEKRVVTGPSPCMEYMWMDTRKIPLDVRRAIAVAWPFDTDNKVAGAIPGLTWYPATGIMSPVTPGFLKFDAVGNGGKGDGDPAKAKKMLEKAGKLGFELQFYFSSDDSIDQQLATARKVKLEAAGFKVKPIPQPEAQARVLDRNPKAPVNLRDSTWCLDWANGDSVIPPILDGRKASLPGGMVPSYLDVPAINNEIERLEKMPSDKAIPEWGKLDKMIMTKYLPAVPLGSGGETLFHGSKVENVVEDTNLGNPDYTQIWVKQ